MHAAIRARSLLPLPSLSENQRSRHVGQQRVDVSPLSSLPPARLAVQAAALRQHSRDQERQTHVSLVPSQATFLNLRKDTGYYPVHYVLWIRHKYSEDGGMSSRDNEHTDMSE